MISGAHAAARLGRDCCVTRGVNGRRVYYVRQSYRRHIVRLVSPPRQRTNILIRKGETSREKFILRRLFRDALEMRRD